MSRASEAICPLCGGPNGCAMAAGEPPRACWCMDRIIPDEMLDRVPAGARSRCICQACVETFLATGRVRRYVAP